MRVWEPLIDYYLAEYEKEKKHGTTCIARAGMLQGLIWICRFYGIGDDDLGEERLSKVKEPND